jgi:hypothetical protein
VKQIIVTDEQFRHLPAEQRADAILTKQLLPVIKAMGERQIKFVISTEAVDRMNDTIAADGWALANYLRNPVVLWAHMRDAVPLAKAPATAVEGKALVSVAEFAKYEFADLVYELTLGGFLNAASIGMRPLEYAYVEESARPWGIDFKRQELLEWSIVPVPANPEALSQAKAAGHNIEPLMKWATDILAVGSPTVKGLTPFHAVSEAAARLTLTAGSRR